MLVKVTEVPLCVLTEWPLRVGWERDFLERRLLSEGIYASQIRWLSVLESRPYSGLIWRASPEALADGKARVLAELQGSPPNVVLALGDFCTKFLTGQSGVDKWQASVLPAEGYKVIPCYPMDRVGKDLTLQVWLSLCARKAARELSSPTLERTPHVFYLNPSLPDTLDYLRTHVRGAERVSVDIETGRGQINTVGFAISGSEAVAINVLPDRMGASAHSELWREIAIILESDQPKILQNFIYEHLFFSRYGIELRGVTHDTMIAQKFLWPELEMGLDAVGRMYTDMPYWKDDGKEWNNIRDWSKHYEYNCKDTCGTFAGYLGQVADLRDRGLSDLHDRYITRLFPAIAEMCSWGIPVSRDALSRLQRDIARDYDEALADLRSCPDAQSLNPRSPAQVKKFFASRGYAIPKKYSAKDKGYKESTDEKSLKKLRMKYPEDASIPALLRLAKLGKAQSSYLSFAYDADGRMRFMLNAHGTETGRFSGSRDPWGGGVNPQTVPGGNKGINIKEIFAAEPGFTFLQCDLRQAESRFVAYDAADSDLIRVLEDPTQDIHTDVAREILVTLGKPLDLLEDAATKKFWRQLGKKSGHGANYSMKEMTFMETCIQEMDVVLTRHEATTILEAYHKLFPGIRRWHASLRRELAQTRLLRTPFGRERHFYGRLDDEMYRQAYAYRPQSCIPDVTNHLMLHLLESRKQGAFDFRLLLQCHDSVLLEVPQASVPKIARECLATEHWHPKIELAGGRLIIPTEVEVGPVWGDMMKFKEAAV